MGHLALHLLPSDFKYFCYRTVDIAVHKNRLKKGRKQQNIYFLLQTLFLLLKMSDMTTAIFFCFCYSVIVFSLDC